MIPTLQALPQRWNVLLPFRVVIDSDHMLDELRDKIIDRLNTLSGGHRFRRTGLRFCAKFCLWVLIPFRVVIDSDLTKKEIFLKIKNNLVLIPFRVVIDSDNAMTVAEKIALQSLNTLSGGHRFRLNACARLSRRAA